MVRSGRTPEIGQKIRTRVVNIPAAKTGMLLPGKALQILELYKRHTEAEVRGAINVVCHFMAAEGSKVTRAAGAEIYQSIAASGLEKDPMYAEDLAALLTVLAEKGTIILRYTDGVPGADGSGDKTIQTRSQIPIIEVMNLEAELDRQMGLDRPPLDTPPVSTPVKTGLLQWFLSFFK
ncbi:MAG: hypothetical protein WC890_07800 [Candidatus Margulisiibacteriota bacterium]